MIERCSEHSEYLVFERFAEVAGLSHAVFTRKRGFSDPPFAGLNASTVTGDVREPVLRNHAELVAVLGLPLVGALPVHGANVAVVERRQPERRDGPNKRAAWLEPLRQGLRATRADAMIANEPGFALCWAFGDCAPILLYDTRHRAFALIHAGWRGTALAVVHATVRAMGERFSTRPGDLLAGLGPAIGACCYEVGPEVRDGFAEHPLAWESAVFEERPIEPDGEPRLYLDVRASNYRQLRAAGVPADQIEDSGYCTGCHTDLFYSHRKEPKPSGRFAVAIGLREA